MRHANETRRKLNRYVLIALIALALLVSFLIAWQFVPPLNDAPPLPATLNLSRAAWIGVEWSMEAHTDAEIADFARELRERGITDAFIYVSYLRPDGAFNPTYDHAAEFTHRMRGIVRDVRLRAWIGVPIHVQGDGAAINRLEDPAIRAQIAGFAAMTVRDLGFDGVHLNAELAQDGIDGLLATLDVIRAALPNGALLSTTAHALRLTRPVTLVPYPVVAHHWSAAYLRDVAAHVDQVALMAYDSGLPFPADYRNWMAYQVRESTETLADWDGSLLIGIPTSEEWTVSHQTQAETLDAALYGLRVGLSESASPHALDGIAMYPYWETSADEWALIDASADR